MYWRDLQPITIIMLKSDSIFEWENVLSLLTRSEFTITSQGYIYMSITYHW